MNTTPTTPPKCLLRLLRIFCHPDFQEDIEGDLLEQYEIQVVNRGRIRANWFFFLSVISLLKSNLIRPLEGYRQLNSYGMLKTNIKIAFRTFVRYKNSFLINLIGLSTGLASVIFIFLWVQNEFQMDKFHKHDAQLFRLVNNTHNNAVLLNTSKIFGDQLKVAMPEIEEVVYCLWAPMTSYFSTGDHYLPAYGEFGTANFFKTFSYDLIEGNPETVLDGDQSVVISEDLAYKLFNTTQGVVGKKLNWQWFSSQKDVFVSGIFKNLPANASHQFDYVLTFDIAEKRFKSQIEAGNRNVRTALKLKEGTDIGNFNAKIRDYTFEHYPNARASSFVIPYSSLYLYGNYENGQLIGGRIEYVRLFSFVAVFVLLLACINFMNLSTAKASRRMKEIGVRKAIGANKKALIFQHLTEAVVLSLLALGIAVLLVFFLLPQFNQIMGKQIELKPELNLILTFLGISIMTGLLAGSYPALYLSSFQPTTILKGIRQTSLGELWTRNGLVIFQFSLSVIFIVSIIVIYQQVDLIQTKNLGYNKDQIVSFRPQGWVAHNQNAFIEEAKKVQGVKNASNISHAFFGGQASIAAVEWEGKHPDEQIWFEHGRVNYDFFEMMEIEMAEGRTFSKDFPADENKIILNETAVEQMNLENPVGKTMKIWDQDWEIIGVTNDFHFESVHEPIRPAFFRLTTGWSLRIVMKLDANNIKETIVRLEDLHEKLNPEFPFEYRFFNQEFKANYESEQRVAILSKYFTGLAILISCLGLFGLATFTAERRRKEIGIRKILGSGQVRIVKLLSSSFNKMVFIAILIALPISYLLTSIWLDNYAVKIELSWWIFTFSGLLAFGVAWLTIGLQTFKMAQSKPLDCLQDE